MFVWLSTVLPTVFLSPTHSLSFSLSSVSTIHETWKLPELWPPPLFFALNHRKVIWYPQNNFKTWQLPAGDGWSQIHLKKFSLWSVGESHITFKVNNPRTFLIYLKEPKKYAPVPSEIPSNSMITDLHENRFAELNE